MFTGDTILHCQLRKWRSAFSHFRPDRFTVYYQINAEDVKFKKSASLLAVDASSWTGVTADNSTRHCLFYIFRLWQMGGKQHLCEQPLLPSILVLCQISILGCWMNHFSSRVMLAGASSSNAPSLRTCCRTKQGLFHKVYILPLFWIRVSKILPSVPDFSDAWSCVQLGGRHHAYGFGLRSLLRICKSQIVQQERWLNLP